MNIRHQSVSNERPLCFILIPSSKQAKAQQKQRDKMDDAYVVMSYTGQHNAHRASEEYFFPKDGLNRTVRDSKTYDSAESFQVEKKEPHEQQVSSFRI